MAINPDITPPPYSTIYVPGGTTWIQPICVNSGDRIELISETLTNPNGAAQPDVRPDGTPNQGAGYLPHWVYRPMWARLQDVHHPPDGSLVYDGLNGNAGPGPVIRADLQYLYCPWAGTVTIEGGRGPVSGEACPEEIAFAWDQQGRQRTGWWKTLREALWHIRGVGAYDATPVKFPRIPIDGRLVAQMTLTFWNAFNPVDGTPLAIQRPQMADFVWTPDAQTLVLDNGPGTTSATVPVFGRDHAAPLGPFSRVRAAANNVSCIVFGISL